MVNESQIEYQKGFATDIIPENGTVEMLVTFSDDCLFLMHGSKYEGGFTLLFPGGFAIVCPHGYKIDMDVENNELVARETDNGRTQSAI